MTTTLQLSSEAYTSETFDPVFDVFRAGMPEGFEFTVSPNSYTDRNGTVSQAEGLSVTTNDAEYAARIVAAMETAVALLEGYRAARDCSNRMGYNGDSYAEYLIRHDAELAAKGHAPTEWPQSLAGNDGE